MTDQISKIDKIRTIMMAQTHDTAWLWDVIVALGIDMTVLAEPGWITLFDEHKWGSIEIINDERQEIIIWHRPDGSPPAANVSNLPKATKILLFALAGELIKELHKNNKESYVEVGKLTTLGNWNKCEVFLNGNPAEGVVAADAIFGTITKYVINKRTGKPILEGDQLKTMKISGKVDIVVKEKPQGFF